MIAINNVRKIINDQKNSSKTITPQMYETEKISIESKFNIFSSNLSLMLSNGVSEDGLKEVINSYDEYCDQANIFSSGGYLNYKPSSGDNSLNIGFLKQDGKSLNYVVDGMLNKFKIILNDLPSPLGELNKIQKEDFILKCIHEINASKLQTYDEESNTLDYAYTTGSLKFPSLNISLNLHNKNLMTEIIDKIPSNYYKMDYKEQSKLLFQGIAPLVLSPFDDEKVNNAIDSIDTISISKLTNVVSKDESFIKPNDAKNINENISDIFDLVLKEKNTTWIKENVSILNSEESKKILNRENPILDFIEGVFSDKDSKNFNEDLSINLINELLKDDRVNKEFNENNILNYLESDFPEPIIFKSMLNSVNKEKIFGENGIAEKIISLTIGEESSVDHMNNNKILCLTELMNHSEFNVDQKFNIKSSLNLDNLLINSLNKKHEDVLISKDHIKINSLIPKQISFTGENKITLIDYLKESKNHLVLQNMNSSYLNHDKNKTMFSEDGIIVEQVKTKIMEVLKLQGDDNFRLTSTEMKNKLKNAADYCCKFNGAISGTIAFMGVVSISILIGAVKIFENKQNNDLKNKINNYLGDKFCDKVSCKMNDQNKIELIVNKSGMDISVGRLLKGNKIELLEELKGLNSLTNVKTNENEIKTKMLGALKSSDLKDKLESELNKNRFELNISEGSLFKDGFLSNILNKINTRENVTVIDNSKQKDSVELLV